jgi:hypothetical protein
MAWRIDEQLIRGEIDNRIQGRVTGRLWFVGRAEPVELDLEGNAWRDVAGHLLRFTNPAPKPSQREGGLDGFASEQRGVVGDITASRKVKVPDCSMDEVMALIEAGKPFPWHWGNSLYLEWHSERNGRVVIESASYQIEIDAEAAWAMSEADEEAQREANGRAMIAFMERLTGAMDLSEVHIEEISGDEREDEPEDDFFDAGDNDEDDDAPTSAAEARADADQARMDLLLDRVLARIERARAAGEKPDHARIMEEERDRLRRERGETEPEPLAPEEEAERETWIEEMNAAATEAVEAAKADAWMDDDDDEPREHPLVARCTALYSRLRTDCKEREWLTAFESPEHPLRELVNGVMIASGKLAGALNRMDDEDWPPEALFAGGVLVRLKKARGHLRDALAGADDAAERDIAERVWLAVARAEVVKLVAEVETLITEVRAVLEAAGDAETDD